MKILCINWYLEKENDKILKEIKKHFPKDQIHFPYISFMSPKTITSHIQHISEKYDLLIAIGLGCLFSLRVTGIPKILINFRYVKDVEKRFDSSITEYLDELRKLEPDNTSYDQTSSDYLVYTRENPYYIFTENSEDISNLKDIDLRIQYELNPYLSKGLVIDGNDSPFSGNGAEYRFNDEFICYGNVLKVDISNNDDQLNSLMKAIDYCILIKMKTMAMNISK